MLLMLKQISHRTNYHRSSSQSNTHAVKFHHKLTNPIHLNVSWTEPTEFILSVYDHMAQIITLYNNVRGITVNYFLSLLCFNSVIEYRMQILQKQLFQARRKRSGVGSCDALQCKQNARTQEAPTSGKAVCSVRIQLPNTFNLAVKAALVAP